MNMATKKGKTVIWTWKQHVSLKEAARGIRSWPFTPCIPFVQIEYVLGKKESERFMKWMRGQTCPVGGVYEHDLTRFLCGLTIDD